MSLISITVEMNMCALHKVARPRAVAYIRSEASLSRLTRRRQRDFLTASTACVRLNQRVAGGDHSI